MADIKDQLIKDSYNYVLQSDISTGVVYRIGGTIPVNPIFSSGLTINGGFTYSNGTEQPGYALLTDGTGYAYWGPISGASPSSGVTSITVGNGLSANSSTGAVTIVFTGSTSGDYLPLSGGTVTGGTIFQSGLTANTISATTYQNLPTDVYVTGGTYTNGEITFLNNTGGTFTVTGLPIGGPGGQIYYLNLSNSQPPYQEFSPSGTTNSQQTTAVTISNGVTRTIASFQTPTGYPNASLIPAGYWSFYLHSFKQNSNASFNIFCEVYLRTTGGTETLLVTTDPAPVTTNSPNPSMQLTDGYYSGSSINTTDRIVVKVRATNTSNQSHSITLVTEGTQHYSYGITPFSDNSALTCGTLIGCSIIQTIQTDISNKFDKSGGTINGNLTVTGNTSLQGLTATTISATTYQNLPTDIRTTGATYSNNNFTFTNNTGGTYSVLFNTVTGLTVNGGLTVTGNTSLQSLTATTISATTYYNVSSNFQYEIHVSQIDGNDTTGNGTLLNPVASITQALTLLTGSRKTIIVHPGGYNENITVASGNTTIASSELTGANTLLYGTLTIGSLGSGSRISGLKMSNLVISGTAQAYISNCSVDTNVTKSSSGYVEIINTEMQCISGIQISGSGTTIINGNKNVGVSVSNASAQVIIKGCNSVVTPSASAGNLAIVDCIVTALGGNAITITGALTNLTLANSQVLVQAGNNVAPISVAGIYSIFNTVYDKANSSLTGTNTNSIDYFQFINADKFITQGGTSLQYVMGDGSLSNGFTGGTVSGSTNFTNGLTANTLNVTGNTLLSGLTATTISATTYQNLPDNVTGKYLPLSGGTVTGGTVFQSGVTATTISATTYSNLPTDIRTTGGTYSNNTFTFTNNTGGTYSVLFNTVTGLTINGGLTVTGNTSLQGLTATTISATTKTTIGSESDISCALLQMASTTQGVLFPRMTNTQRTSIVSPQPSLMVYCTDFPEGLFMYKSTGWVQII